MPAAKPKAAARGRPAPKKPAKAKAKAPARKGRPAKAKGTAAAAKDPFRPVRPEEVDVEYAKSFFGGSFPRMNGAKHKYPAPENEAAWVKLIAEALTYRKRKKWCYQNGLEEKKHAKASKYEYVLYHGRPDQIKRRATRNRHRHAALKNGTLKPGEELHHQDAKNLRKPVAVTPCQHNRLHGERCDKTLKAAKGAKGANAAGKSKAKAQAKAKVSPGAASRKKTAAKKKS